MRYSVDIDYTKCKACGACRAECNHHLPVYKGARPTEHGVACVGCLHCYAVCPQNAVRVTPEPEQPGTGPAEPLAEVMARRRSCRSYSNRAVPDEVLTEVTRFSSLIPSGGNCHSHEITILTDCQARRDLEAEIQTIYRGKRKMLASPLVRAIGTVISDAETREFIRDPFYLHQISYLLGQFDNGIDPIFYHAPVVMFIHSPRLIPTPYEDSVLATYNMALAAQALGLGTCMVSLAQKAINRSRKLKRLLEMDPTEQVYAVMTLGYPAVRFRRGIHRTPAPVHRIGEAPELTDAEERTA